MFVLIADSHVPFQDPGEDVFFTMLERISRTSYDVLFLGDNLDLWIAAADKYETASHRRFLDWCRHEKEHRQVILVEGNHEFYVCRHHADCFTACTEDVYRIGAVTFVHGDMAHRRFSFHRFFRWFAKNAFGNFVMSWLPGGVGFARFMKRALAHSRNAASWKPASARKPADFIPYDDVSRWVEAETAAHHARLVFMGHFHCGGQKDVGDARLVIIPAWKYHGTIALLDESTREFTIGNWEDILHA